MTNEDAREWLMAIKDKYIHGGDDDFDAKRKEAINMAITALEQQPCEDCISRKEVCNYIAEFVNHEYATDREHEMVEHIIGGIQHLPSIQPKAESENKE